MSIQGYAQSLRAKTRTGAVLMFDGQPFENPNWVINKRRVAFWVKSPTLRFEQSLWDYGDGSPEDAEREARKRIRVLVDA